MPVIAGCIPAKKHRGNVRKSIFQEFDHG